MKKRKEKDCICEMGFICDNPNHSKRSKQLRQFKKLKESEVDDEDLKVFK